MRWPIAAEAARVVLPSRPDQPPSGPGLAPLYPYITDTPVCYYVNSVNCRETSRIWPHWRFRLRIFQPPPPDADHAPGLLARPDTRRLQPAGARFSPACGRQRSDGESTLKRNGTRGHWLAIVLLTLAGGLLLRAAIIRDPGLHVPPILGYVTAAVFFMCALAVLKQLLGVQSTVEGLAPLILAGFTALGAWIALSPDAGGCSVSANDGPGMKVSGLGCRIPFGIGALVAGMMAVYSGIAWFRARKQR